MKRRKRNLVWGGDKRLPAVPTACNPGGAFDFFPMSFLLVHKGRKEKDVSPPKKEKRLTGARRRVLLDTVVLGSRFSIGTYSRSGLLGKKKFIGREKRVGVADISLAFYLGRFFGKGVGQGRGGKERGRGKERRSLVTGFLADLGFFLFAILGKRMKGNPTRV